MNSPKSRSHFLLLASVSVGFELAMGANAAQADSCSTIEQNGVTFQFDRAYSCGQFANGDWWVAPEALGESVVITQIEPVFDGEVNGWEVNPDDPDDQGFDFRISGFDLPLVPELPYVAGANQSVVKTVSFAKDDLGCRPCVSSAAVLTVLEQIPEQDGSVFFRPPYAGDLKPLIPTSRLKMELLPELEPTDSAPTFTEVQESFGQPWLDHKSGWTGRELHPEESMPDYGADIAAETANGALALMLAGDPDEKFEATVRYVQVGLDLYFSYLNGSHWIANGGHSSGRRLPLAMAATLLGDASFTTTVRYAAATDFGEGGSVVLGSQAQIPLWGQECSDYQYWERFRFDKGNKSCADPYGYIDGGEVPGESYQFCCNSSPWRGAALALRLMPNLRCGWPAADFLAYVDRWVEAGAHSQPDPCAGYDGDPDNYGITYGPDDAGGCIADLDPSDGTGRYPNQHGVNANGGHHGSAFHGEMWDAYRGLAETLPLPVCGLLPQAD